MDDLYLLLILLVPAAIIGYLVLAYLVSNNRIKGRFEKPARLIVGIMSSIYALGVVGLLLGIVYVGADEKGLIGHTRHVSVLMEHDWVVGEFKSCTLSDKLLMCDGYSEMPHEMEVLFHGSGDLLDSKKGSKWKCQRKQESTSCKAE
jgi:hypothetical protein